MADEKIRVSWEEVQSPHVDARIMQQQALARAQEHSQQQAAQMSGPPMLPRAPEQGGSIWYNSVFYMAAFGLLGAVPIGVIWNIAFWNEQTEDLSFVMLFLAYVASGILLACSLGAAESLVCRNPREFVKSVGIGSAVGLVAGVVYPLVAGFVMYFTFQVIVAALGEEFVPESPLTVVLIMMIARSPAWLVMGAIIGSTPGIVLHSLKKTGLGVLGGAIGGLLGGLLFDPLEALLGTASVSRFMGICVLGGSAGAAIGLIENAAKTGWLRVVAGLIAGKQFIIYKNPTRIGSSPQCEVYLFKDPQVGPWHAAIHAVPGGYDIEDLQSPSGTLVNGRSVSRVRLKNNDVVQIGTTTLQFQEKPRVSHK